MNRVKLGLEDFLTRGILTVIVLISLCLALTSIVLSSPTGAADQPGSPGATAVATAAKDPPDDLVIEEDDEIFINDDEMEKEIDLDLDDEADVDDSAQEAHEALLAESRYPSAATCGTCHPKHYGEWSVSQHAYAQLSPIYLSLNNKINVLANGSNGDFCLRCHSPVGANLGESPIISNLERHPTSREGITCAVCHRISRNYNKASGRLALNEGGLTEARLRAHRQFGAGAGPRQPAHLSGRDRPRKTGAQDPQGGQAVRVDFDADVLRHLS